MKKYWYRRILIMALVFFVSVGGSYLLIEQKKDAMRREVSAQTSEEDLVIPGGMPVGIYMKTKGVMVLDTQKIKGEDGAEYEPDFSNAIENFTSSKFRSARPSVIACSIICACSFRIFVSFFVTFSSFCSFCSRSRFKSAI